MIYPQNFENKIGFDIIRSKIKANCMGKTAKDLVDEIVFSNNIDLIEKSLNEVNEMMNICNLKDNYPF
jgi:DNA mismatch repair protein MutS2